MEYCPLADGRCQSDECILAMKETCLMKLALEKYTRGVTLADLDDMDEILDESGEDE